LKRVMLEILGGMPFMLATTEGLKVNYNRIIEAVIIAGIAGFLASQLTVSELKMKLAYQEGQISRVETRLSETCNLLLKNQQDVIRIDTLQQERLERERLQVLKGKR